MKWGFVHIPKTGGSSIEAAIGTLSTHFRASEVERPRFTFVRHPLDRLVSAWHHSVERGSVADETFNAATLEKFLATGWTVVVPQTEWLDAEVDFIGRFENLEHDFKRISTEKLPHLNASRRGPWRDYFDSEMIDIAAGFYSEDFKQFKYEVNA